MRIYLVFILFLLNSCQFKSAKVECSHHTVEQKMWYKIPLDSLTGINDCLIYELYDEPCLTSEVCDTSLDIIRLTIFKRQLETRIIRVVSSPKQGSIFTMKTIPPEHFSIFSIYKLGLPIKYSCTRGKKIFINIKELQQELLELNIEESNANIIDIYKLEFVNKGKYKTMSFYNELSSNQETAIKKLFPPL